MTTFRDLHRGNVLVLPNAWDVASARLIENAGARAIATTSAGVAWSLGAPDGDRLGREAAVALVARIVAAVAVPVSADIEGGYDDPGTTARAVADAGAAGINVEDVDHSTGALLATQAGAERIAAIRAAAGPELFVNARIDTFLRAGGDIADTVQRARAYLAAGADGIFVPGAVDPDTIKELAVAIDAPLNVMAGPGAPDVPTLAGLGVARVSVGSAIAQSAYALAARAAAEVLSSGTYGALEGALDYGTINQALTST